MIKVSKELYESVYGKTLEQLYLDSNDLKNIDFNSFYFKCKDWALSKGYMMKIENHYSNSIQIQIRKPTSNSKYIEPWKKTFKDEITGMITSCEWIRKELK